MAILQRLAGNNASAKKPVSLFSQFSIGRLCAKFRRLDIAKEGKATWQFCNALRKTMPVLRNNSFFVLFPRLSAESSCATFRRLDIANEQQVTWQFCNTLRKTTLLFCEKVHQFSSIFPPIFSRKNSARILGARTPDVSRL